MTNIIIPVHNVPVVLNDTTTEQFFNHLASTFGLCAGIRCEDCICLPSPNMPQQPTSNAPTNDAPTDVAPVCSCGSTQNSSINQSTTDSTSEQFDFEFVCSRNGTCSDITSDCFDSGD
jgi:hypothetical protein